jgi:hypothetical protein
VRDAFDKKIRDESRALKTSAQSGVGVGNLLRRSSILTMEPDEYE